MNSEKLKLQKWVHRKQSNKISYYLTEKTLSSHAITSILASYVVRETIKKEQKVGLIHFTTEVEVMRIFYTLQSEILIMSP